VVEEEEIFTCRTDKISFEKDIVLQRCLKEDEDQSHKEDENPFDDEAEVGSSDDETIVSRNFNTSTVNERLNVIAEFKPAKKSLSIQAEEASKKSIVDLT